MNPKLEVLREVLREIQSYQEALIFHTAEKWIDCLIALLPMSTPPAVNFWSGDLNDYHLKRGAPFLFKRARSGVIVGFGTFVRKSNMTIERAWQKYGHLNGVKRPDEFLSSAMEILRMRSPRPDSMIGCFEIHNPVFAERHRWIPLADYGISEYIRCKYIPFRTAVEIIDRLGFKWDNGPFLNR